MPGKTREEQGGGGLVGLLGGRERRELVVADDSVAVQVHEVEVLALSCLVKHAVLVRAEPGVDVVHRRSATLGVVHHVDGAEHSRSGGAVPESRHRGTRRP